ncbi:MAG: response regulator [Candidatus Lokiarchaeota archaeon]|nr:response regulator [Candidatus Lokiarchaeota archaeon]
MHEKILVVDDNKDILFNLKILLEKRGYEVLTSMSGDQALKTLSTLKEPPEVIISDIKMPNMDGYEFFKAVSTHSQWNQIPFLFLTAKSTTEDIRLGKMLGVDDYITKPFNEEDLIASISGKITRKQKSELINNKVKDLLNFYQIEMQPSITEEDQLPFCLLVVFWDDIEGPVLKKSHPSEKSCHISINRISQQLFHAATTIYGHDKITRAEGVLLNIENIKKRGYLFFDAFPDKKERFGEKQFMLSVIAPSITYLDSLKIREIFKEISEKIKNKKVWEIENYWMRILRILSTGSPLLKTP